MLLAVTPQQAANLPDIAARTAMRAATYLASPLYGKLNDIGPDWHGLVKLVEKPGIDCERTLTGVPPARICTKTETCVGISGRKLQTVVLMTKPGNCCIF